ncbi:MAG: hypothetical protein A3B65_02205 [Acidobacteria bacterium RIFCSPHIGHO2_02_FULL_67_57]|nr:MAG: hypothetical protein A3B65_02205 [Acidobacteria bacterium RIFCSPHIGHO2_02_FULL_67_57]
MALPLEALFQLRELVVALPVSLPQLQAVAGEQEKHPVTFVADAAPKCASLAKPWPWNTEADRGVIDESWRAVKKPRAIASKERRMNALPEKRVVHLVRRTPRTRARTRLIESELRVVAGDERRKLRLRRRDSQEK